MPSVPYLLAAFNKVIKNAFLYIIFHTMNYILVAQTSRKKNYLSADIQ